MRNFWEHKTTVFLIAATLVAALLIGIFSALASGEKAGAAENVIGAVAEPGQAAVSGTGNWFTNLFSGFGSVKALRAENAALKQENMELDKKLRDMQGMEEENDRLRAMLDLTKTENKLDLAAAQVIAKDPSNWYSSFTINKGTNDGIEKNQPVFTADLELVGRVYKVGSSWAEIITILDPESGVGSMVQRTKDVGVVEGDSALRNQGYCRLGYLSRDAEVAVGDYVETSGMGGVFPKGLLIGKVMEITEDNATMSKYATVEPLVDMSKLTEVFVLQSYTEEIKVVTIADDEEDEREEDEEDGETEEKQSSSATSKPTTQPTTKPTSKPTTKPTERPTTKPTVAPSSAGSSSQAMNGSELSE